MRTKEKTATEEMIDQLNSAEEVMAALDQAADKTSPIGRACWQAYSQFDCLRDSEAKGWNADLNPGEKKIYRCSEASKPYHTDADGPCDVWSTDEVCGQHIARAEKQMGEARW